MKNNHIIKNKHNDTIVSFQDLQNEECALTITNLGDIWIGRNCSKKMNLSIKQLEDIVEFYKSQLNKI